MQAVAAGWQCTKRWPKEHAFVVWMGNDEEDSCLMVAFSFVPSFLALGLIQETLDKAFSLHQDQP